MRKNLSKKPPLCLPIVPFGLYIILYVHFEPIGFLLGARGTRLPVLFL